MSPPRDPAMIWLIARRAALESFRDRSTMLMSILFAFLVPVGVLLLSLGALRASDGVGVLLALYLLLIAMMPAVTAVGIAAGQFAGEKERGVLTPLLATPASNLAIFGGKVLGSILPPLTYAAIGDVVYLTSAALLLGPGALRLIPLDLTAAMLLLVPLMTTLCATVASLISSRVRTYNAAQQVTGLALVPVWGALATVALRSPEWGSGAVATVDAILITADVALLLVAAATWRREEVLSHT